MFDIMSLLGGDQTQAPAAQPAAPSPSPSAPADPAAHAGWNDFLSNPSVQAGLLSFGLSALSGGYGSAGQNLAYSVGQGAEAAGNNSQVLKVEVDNTQAKADKKQATAFDQDYKNRELQGRKDVANIAANSRMDVANIRTGSGAKNLQEQKFYQSAYQKALSGLNSQNTAAVGVGSPALFTDDEMQTIAGRQADAALQSYRTQFGSGAGPGAQNGDVSSANSPTAGGNNSPGQSADPKSRPSAANVGAPVKGAVSPKATYKENDTVTNAQGQQAKLLRQSDGKLKWVIQ